MRPFSPLNKFSRQARIRVLDDGTGTVGPISSGLSLTGSVVAATSEAAAADAPLADATWTSTGVYIGTYTDADGLIWGVYQFVIDGAVITVAKHDAAFPDGTDPYFLVHLAGTLHAVERLDAKRTRKASIA